MFKNFPLFKYSGKEGIVIRDIYFRIQLFFKKYQQNLEIFNEYVIIDGDTPESVSYDFYYDSKFYFLILLINSRYDPFYDWPLTNEEVLQRSIKYVTEDYWEIQDQMEYNPKNPSDIDEPLVDNMIGRVFQQLTNENDKKRSIYLPDRPLMEQIYKEYMKITSNLESEQ